MHTPANVHVCEVGPRDGLQNEPVQVGTADKLRLIRGLDEAALPEIEVTSFVRSDVIPQLADAEEVLGTVLRTVSARIRVLVPNLKGAERALRAGAPELLLVTAASDTFNRKNIRRSVEESLAEIDGVVATAASHDATVMLSIATSFGCPYEGDIPQSAVTRVVEAASRAGVKRIEIADTIGVANPAQVFVLCETLQREFSNIRFELHFHDTRGLALANVLAAMDAEIVEFAASLGGMGGCPFAPGATGNVCTLDLVNMLNEMGVNTGVHLDSLIELGRWLEQLLGHKLPSRVLHAGVFSHTPHWN
jgi:hydroxymethylglutaryl-CoA lyase